MQELIPKQLFNNKSDIFPNRNIGYIYVLSNPLFHKDVFKLGYTTREIDSRIKELNSLTSTPAPFILEACFKIIDPYKLEQLIHSKLQNYRTSDREFFKIKLYNLLKIIISLIGPSEISRHIYSNLFNKDLSPTSFLKRWWRNLDIDWKRALLLYVFEDEEELSEYYDDYIDDDYWQQFEVSDSLLFKIVCLRKLSVSYGRLTNLEPLSILTELTELDCSNNNIFSINPLINLAKLEYLDISYNKITNIDAIAKIKRLKYLNIDRNSIADISPAKNLKDLECLVCARTNITDLDTLDSLKKLKKLDCSITSIRSLEPIRNLKELQEIDCSYTLVSDLTVIKELQKLEKINIRYAPVNTNSFQEICQSLPTCKIN